MLLLKILRYLMHVSVQSLVDMFGEEVLIVIAISRAGSGEFGYELYLENYAGDRDINAQVQKKWYILIISINDKKNKEAATKKLWFKRHIGIYYPRKYIVSPLMPRKTVTILGG